MQTRPTQLTDVIYNAANQSFEALVTVHDGATSHKYPCSIDAPISMTFGDAAKGLTTQAMRRHNAKSGMYSQITTPTPPVRAGRRNFDPMRWLESLMNNSGARAA